MFEKREEGCCICLITFVASASTLVFAKPSAMDTTNPWRRAWSSMSMVYIFSMFIEASNLVSMTIYERHHQDVELIIVIISTIDVKFDIYWQKEKPLDLTIKMFIRIISNTSNIFKFENMVSEVRNFNGSGQLLKILWFLFNKICQSTKG